MKVRSTTKKITGIIPARVLVNDNGEVVGLSWCAEDAVALPLPHAKRKQLPRHKTPDTEEDYFNLTSTSTESPVEES